MDKKEKIKRSFIIVIIMVVAIISMWKARERRIRKQQEREETKIVEKKEGYNMVGNYNVDIIKKFHEIDDNSNYLISPYNIEIALNMLREGADGKTKEELDKVLGNRIISDVSVKDKIGIANGIFIKDIHKDKVQKEFYNIMNTKYHSEVIYDSFTSPDKINDWVKEKTNNMIPKILDKMNDDFVMGLASALSIDVKWLSEFKCDETLSEEFTKIDNSKINVEMMHKLLKNSQYKYFKTDDAEGVIIPYRKENDSNIELEFVGILPNDNVDTFIKNLTFEKLNNFDKDVQVAGESLHINLSLPRFKYDYDAKYFIDILKEMGIIDAFDKDKANFKKMIILDENVYVGEAIHKTHIELNEVGTKAAAITYFGMFENSAYMPNESKVIDIKFNKPFIYMIRDKNSKEILFFGTVYEPNIWNGSTCDNI